MGTKNNPGAFDCYANAEPDEPMFVLLGRDPSAHLIVTMWAMLRARMGEDPAKVEEARSCARAMFACASAQGKTPRQAEAYETFLALVRDLAADSARPGSLEHVLHHGF